MPSQLQTKAEAAKAKNNNTTNPGTTSPTTPPKTKPVLSPEPKVHINGDHRCAKHDRYHSHYHHEHHHNPKPTANDKSTQTETNIQSHEQVNNNDLSSWSHISLTRRGAVISSVSAEGKDNNLEKKRPYYIHRNIPRVNEPSVKITKESLKAMEAADAGALKLEGLMEKKGGDAEAGDDEDDWDLV